MNNKNRIKDRLGDREEVRLDELMYVNSGKDYKHLEYGNIPVYGSGGYMLSVDKAISVKNAIGIGRKGTITKPVKLIAPFWTVDTLFWCIVKGNNDYNYIYYLIKNINFMKYNEGSTLPSLSSSTINSILVKKHEMQIQEKIGETLSSIDILIEKQEGYIESLIEKKEAYVRHFFSHTNNFEYKAFKLKDLFDIQNIGSDKKIKKGEKEVNLLNYMDVYKKKIYTNMKVTIPYDKYDDMTVKKDDLFITPSSETAKDIMNAFVIPEELNNYVYSYHIMRLRAKMDINSKYVEEYLNSKDQRRNFAKLATGAQRYTISKDTIQNYIIYIVSLEEQNKIASLLASMDKLIELNEKKLEQLKLKKKYYLNEIFK